MAGVREIAEPDAQSSGVSALPEPSLNERLDPVVLQLLERALDIDIPGKSIQKYRETVGELGPEFGGASARRILEEGSAVRGLMAGFLSQRVLEGRSIGIRIVGEVPVVSDGTSVLRGPVMDVGLAAESVLRGEAVAPMELDVGGDFGDKLRGSLTQEVLDQAREMRERARRGVKVDVEGEVGVDPERAAVFLVALSVLAVRVGLEELGEMGQKTHPDVRVGGNQRM